MTAQTIINAARETSMHYRLVHKDDKIAMAFLAFSNAIRNEMEKEELAEEKAHRISYADSQGSTGQG